MGIVGRFRGPWFGALSLLSLGAAACGGRVAYDDPDITSGGASGSGGSTPARGGSSGAFGKGGAGGMMGACLADDVPGTSAHYDAGLAATADPNGTDFFAFPWPELSRQADAFFGFPNPPAATGCAPSISDPTLAQLLGGVDPLEYRAYVGNLAGNYLSSGPNNAAVYITFNDWLDASRLPLPAQTLDAASPVLLVNVDDQSPGLGRLVPVLTRVFDSSRYLPPNTLSILPHPGFPLAPGGLYAAVVTRSLGDAFGQPLGSPGSFERLKLSDCAENPGEYALAFERLEAELAIPRDEIAMMTVFRAGTPENQLTDVITRIDAMNDPASLATISVDSVSEPRDQYYVLDGSFETLIYQYGTPPYLPPISVGLTPDVSFEISPNGSFLVGPPPIAAGGPDTSVPRTERVAFRLSIPSSIVAASGTEITLPVVVYGPGTGGSLNSPFEDDSARELAARSVATFSTDPVMHDARAHAENIDPALIEALQYYDSISGGNATQTLLDTVQRGDLFFNPLDLQAAKGNSLQAAVDYAWQGRLLAAVSLQADLGGLQRTIRFDPARRYFVGHSQGAATGPLLAGSTSYQALVLSQPSGHLPSNLLGKTKPEGSLGIAQMLSYIVCEDPAEPMDVHHPFLNLLMHWFEEADAVNYAARLQASAPKHVFVLSGTNDHYVPKNANDAVTTAARLWQVAPELGTSTARSLLTLLTGQAYDQTHGSVAGNVVTGNGEYTAAFRQYHDEACADDHFVYTCNQTARSDWLYFIQTALGSAYPSVPWQ